MIAPASILFDLDGTLVDSARGIAVALTRLSKGRGGPEVSVVQVRTLVSLGAQVLVREGLGSYALDADADLAAFRANLLAVVPDPDSIYPGVIGALEVLAEAGHLLAIVTNKPEQLSLILLEQLGLARFFEVVVGGDTLSQCKPDPAPLCHALHLLGDESRPALMIGDSAVDALAARAAQMPFILFEGGYGAADCQPADTTASFTHFESLPRLVGAEIAIAHGRFFGQSSIVR